MKRIFTVILSFFIFISCIPSARAANDVPEEVMDATRSVVRISAEYWNGSSSGSGFVIKNEPGEMLVVTNDHVVEGSPSRISIWVDEYSIVDAEIVFTDPAKDLCVLEVTEPVEMAPLKLSTEDARHGSAIYVVGYPSAGDILSDTTAHTSDSATITDGIISAIRTFTIEEGEPPVQLLQINAAVNSGNSGGPLFNSRGEVIGVNTYKVNANSQGVFGAVDIHELWDLLDEYGIEITCEAPGRAEVEEKKTDAFPWIIIAFAFSIALAVILFLIYKLKKQAAMTAVPEGEQEPPQRAQTKPGLAVILVSSAAAITIIALTVTTVVIPNVKYSKAKDHMRAREYQQAAALFAELGDYREAEEKYNEAMYYHAESLLLAEDYKTAAEIFRELGLFKDSKERVKEAEFAFAQALMEQGEYEQAQERFKKLGSYQGARRYAEECREMILVQKMSAQWDGEWRWIHPGWINPYDTYYIDIAKREIHWAFKSPATEFHNYYSFKLLDVNTIVADGFRAEDDGCEITIRMVEPGKIKLEYPRGGDAPSSDPNNLYLIRPQ